MAKPPLNSDVGRKHSAEARSATSKRRDGRIILDVATGVNAGATTLKTLVKLMNEAGSRTRTGKVWTIPLISMELKALGEPVKQLFKRTVFVDLVQRMDWSEKAYWRVIEEQQQIADRNGLWVSATKAVLRKNNPVRHFEHGIGYFWEALPVNMLCRFWVSDYEFAKLTVKPVDLEVFVWCISIKQRDEIFGRIRASFLTESELVLASSITLEQRHARRRAMRWM